VKIFESPLPRPSRDIVIPAFVIKHENGLWFYLLDLILLIDESVVKRKRANINIHILLKGWQVKAFKSWIVGKNLGVNPVFLRPNMFSFDYMSTFFRYRSSIILSPSLRPFFGGNTYFICHDFWPMMQANVIKRWTMKAIYEAGLKFSNPIYVSKHHAGKNWSERLIIPNEPKINMAITGDYIPCDIMIVGVETLRKRINLLQLWVDYAVSQNIIDKNPKIVIVGDIPKRNGGLSLRNIDVSYHSPDKMMSFVPLNDKSVYLSLSCEEGFNRGAMIGRKLGFKLQLSDIPVHKEFFPDAQFFSVNANNVIERSSAASSNRRSEEAVTWASNEKVERRKQALSNIISNG
jgi:hypothetical protein